LTDFQKKALTGDSCGSLCRRNAAATAAASHGAPDWNVTPGAIVRRHASPSGSLRHELASIGSRRPSASDTVTVS
jgi:hypothetical protein